MTCVCYVFEQSGDEAADEECEEGSGEGGEDDIEAILALGGKCKKKGTRLLGFILTIHWRGGGFISPKHSHAYKSFSHKYY